MTSHRPACHPSLQAEPHQGQQSCPVSLPAVQTVILGRIVFIVLEQLKTQFSCWIDGIPVLHNECTFFSVVIWSISAGGFMPWFTFNIFQSKELNLSSSSSLSLSSSRSSWFQGRNWISKFLFLTRETKTSIDQDRRENEISLKIA